MLQKVAGHRRAGPLRLGVDYRAEVQAALGSGFIIERDLVGAGTSHVFVAHEQALGRHVVVKMLPKEKTSGVNAERFRREIAVAALLQHPHLVPLLTSGVATSADVPWFAMPYIEGESLRDLITRRAPLPVVMAVRIMREIASALSYAHARKIVHRDIKPENVLLSDGIAMVTDFGVAMALDIAITGGTPSRRRLTGAGMTLGTPAYSPPEQIESAGAVDHRADLYSFGCVAYEMLAGSPPFEGRNLRDLLSAQISEPPKSIDQLRIGLPTGLTQLVMSCLQKDPEKRPQSAGDIVRDLDSLTMIADPVGAVGSSTPDLTRLAVRPAAKTSTLPIIFLLTLTLLGLLVLIR